jgi:hypothetical protein
MAAIRGTRENSPPASSLRAPRPRLVTPPCDCSHAPSNTRSSLPTIHAIRRQMKQDTVSAHFRSNSLKTNKTDTKQAGHFFEGSLVAQTILQCTEAPPVAGPNVSVLLRPQPHNAQSRARTKADRSNRTSPRRSSKRSDTTCKVPFGLTHRKQRKAPPSK